MDQTQPPIVNLEDQLRTMMLSNLNKPQHLPQQPKVQRHDQVSNGNSAQRSAQERHAVPRGGYTSGRGRGGTRGNSQQLPRHARAQQLNNGHQQPVGAASPRNLRYDQTQNGTLPPHAAPNRGLPYRSQQQGRGSKFTPLNRPQHPVGNTINVQCTYLQLLADQVVPQVRLRHDEMEKKEEFRRHLEKICQDLIITAYKPAVGSVELIAFGSLSSGFATTGSDMDLAFMSLHERPGFFRILEAELLKIGIGAHLLARTRVPIIKVCQSPSPELLEALRMERQKWDDMTPEERERYDSSSKAEAETHAELKAKLPASVDGPATIEPAEQLDRTLKASKAHVHGSGTVAQVDASTINNSEVQLREPTEITGYPDEMSEFLSVPNLASTTSEADDKADEVILTADPTSMSKPLPSGSTGPSDATTEQLQANSTRQARPVKIWYREKRLGPLDFPKDGVGVQCDINQANPLGLHNTHLLRCYNACDTRVQDMILFIKAWASARMINSSRHGTLSSYGYVLMVLHYLINIADPPVCPNLQHSRLTGGPMPDPHDPNAFCEGRDVRFWRNEAEIRQLASRGFISHNKQPLGMLLRGFFMYFSEYNGFVWMQQVLSLRTLGSGILSKEQKGWTGAKTTMHEKVSNPSWKTDCVSTKCLMRHLGRSSQPIPLRHRRSVRDRS